MAGVFFTSGLQWPRIMPLGRFILSSAYNAKVFGSIVISFTCPVTTRKDKAQFYRLILLRALFVVWLPIIPAIAFPTPVGISLETMNKTFLLLIYIELINNSS